MLFIRKRAKKTKLLVKSLCSCRRDLFAKGFVVLRSGGIKEFTKRLKEYCEREVTISASSVAREEKNKPVYHYRDIWEAEFRNLQPITVFNDDAGLRVNIVTDSLDGNSLLGGVATALIIAVMFSNKIGAKLRIITRSTRPNPSNFYKTMKRFGLKTLFDVEFYSDYDRDFHGKTHFKMSISENDIFIATSWWSAAVIKKINRRKKLFYIIQEVETFFYPHGDMHYMCSQIMQDKDIIYLVNSEFLYSYFKENEKNIYENGTYFKPAFPTNLYKPDFHRKRKKYNLFFYARPENPRNLFYLGLNALDTCILNGSINTALWDIHLVGQNTSHFVFTSGYKPKMWGLMDWGHYASFLSKMDMGLSLMYTPHTSYPPFDMAAAGCVVVTNKHSCKKEISETKNIISSDLDERSLCCSITKGLELAQDIQQREKNYNEATIPDSWEDTLAATIKLMTRKM